jgi:ubiquinone/menaquinone biosynthesis C-methylase UbiE
MLAPITYLLEQPWVYRLWQAPFAERKFAPVLAHGDLGHVRRVLDVACGPGTNAHYFASASYVGMDVNRRYMVEAGRRNQRRFVVADAGRLPIGRARFDCVLVNSFLHHVDTPGVRAILHDLDRILSDDGHVHLLELVLPAAAGPARLLARLDRGKHPRPLETWRELFAAQFETEVFEAYALTFAGTPLWHMVYFKGRRGRR